MKATHIDDFPGWLGVGEDVSDELLSQIVIFNVKHLGGLDDKSDHNNQVTSAPVVEQALRRQETPPTFKCHDEVGRMMMIVIIMMNM